MRVTETLGETGRRLRLLRTPLLFQSKDSCDGLLEDTGLIRGTIAVADHGEDAKVEGMMRVRAESHAVCDETESVDWVTSSFVILVNGPTLMLA